MCMTKIIKRRKEKNGVRNDFSLILALVGKS